MLTKSVIVALGLLIMVNRSLSLSCRPCNWNECGPSPNCTYGVTMAVCSCCYDECKKGPGESCNGLWGFSGRCGDVLECKVIHDIHNQDFSRSGICFEQGQIDECKDTWPGTECITRRLLTMPSGNYTETQVCSCEDVVEKGLCTNPNYHNLANVCELSCDLCEPTSTTPDTTITTIEDSSATPDLTITPPEATSTTPDAMITTSGCGGVFDSNIGTIRYPLNGIQYKNNEDCTWIIRATNPIEIKFSTFNTETCCDTLFIRDGETSKSGVLGIFSGDSIPSTVQTTTHAAYLYFTSDYSINNTGFLLHWESLSVSGIVVPETYRRLRDTRAWRTVPDSYTSAEVDTVA